MTGRHLAHFNWSALRAPVGDPLVAPFADAIAKVNAKAEASDGFVWRCGIEDAEGTRIGWPLFTENPTMIASFSVWETPEAFGHFVFKTVHGAFLKRGSEWFLPGEGARHVLWWVPAGTIPTIEEAREKVSKLERDGPSHAAFTFDTLPVMGDS